MANEEIKKRAAKALRVAGRAHLAEVGGIPNSTGRQWTVDWGWWLINIEFQASSYSVGSYLNVGLQHLWLPRDHRVFEYGYRQRDIAGRDGFVSFEVDDEDLVAAADGLARTAREAAERWTALFTDDVAHLEWLTGQRDDPYDAFNAAFAMARLGSLPQAAHEFSNLARKLETNDPSRWQLELAGQARHLARLTTAEELDDEFDTRVARSRELLRLPAQADQQTP